ncbi:MAG: hypothetical protein ACRDTU_16895 [Micromonosporaceae bacterium]
MAYWSDVVTVEAPSSAGDGTDTAADA